MRIIADDLSINAISLYDIFRLLMTNDGHKICKDLDSPSLKNPAIQNFSRVARAKGSLPQIHVALDNEDEFVLTSGSMIISLILRLYFMMNSVIKFSVSLIGTGTGSLQMKIRKS